MDFGILSLASVDSWKDVAFAEAKGFTHAWIADSQMVWADPYQYIDQFSHYRSAGDSGMNRCAPSTAAFIPSMIIERIV